MSDLAASPHRATLPNCDGCGQFTSTPTVVDNSWHGGAGMYMCGELLLCPRCAPCKQAHAEAESVRRIADLLDGQPMVWPDGNE